MSTWADIKYLIRQYLPNESLTGKGVTLSSLQGKLIHKGILDANYNVIVRPFDEFPFGSGFEPIDITILLKLPDDILLSTCKTDKHMASVCASNEFWRRKLSILLDLEIRAESGSVSDYKQLYFMFKRSRSIVFDAVSVCNMQIFDKYIKSYQMPMKFVFDGVVSKSMLCDNPHFFQSLMKVRELDERQVLRILEGILISKESIHGPGTILYILNNVIEHPDVHLVESLIGFGNIKLYEQFMRTHPEMVDKLRISHVLTAAHSLDMVQFIYETFFFDNPEPDQYIGYAIYFDQDKTLDAIKYLVSKLKGDPIVEQLTNWMSSHLSSKESMKMIDYFVDMGASEFGDHELELLTIYARNGRLEDVIRMLEDLPESIDMYRDLLTAVLEAEQHHITVYLLDNKESILPSIDMSLKKIVEPIVNELLKNGPAASLELMGQYVSIVSPVSVENLIKEIIADDGDMSANIELLGVLLRNGNPVPKGLLKIIDLVGQIKE
jgi:hypothetical protein